MKKCPDPLEWHPAYRDKTFLLDWLNDPARPAVVKLPILRPLVARFASGEEVPELGFATRTMTRHKAWGLAPYAGQPFVYSWWVGEDDLGRCIASDSWIEYLPKELT